MSEPRVSVVMAAYRGATLIRETIESLLAQTMTDFEVVVMDDCSPDETAAEAASTGDPRVRVIRTPRNSGPAVARTLGLEHARGQFVAALDHDDLCRPDRFARQLDYLDRHPDVVLVSSAIAPFGIGAPPADAYPDLTDPGEIDWTMLLLNPIAWSSVMIRVAAARALLPFQRDERRYAEDFDLYHRIRQFGRIGRIPEPLVRYRHHAGNASRQHEELMIRSAGAVLATAYAGLFDGREEEAGLLMSRHTGASYPPADQATLARIGAVLARLLEARGALAPGFAPASASHHWWRLARAGLRAGAYDAAALEAARPAFARAGDAGGLRLARDRAVGAGRRLIGRRTV